MTSPVSGGIRSGATEQAPGQLRPESAGPLAGDVLPAPPGASRRLLGSLLRPSAQRILLAAVLLLLQQAAEVAGPLLVAYTIDHVIPAIRAGDSSPLAWVAGGYLASAVTAGALRRAFILVSSCKSVIKPPATRFPFLGTALLLATAPD